MKLPKDFLQISDRRLFTQGGLRLIRESIMALAEAVETLEDIFLSEDMSPKEEVKTEEVKDATSNTDSYPTDGE